MLKPRQLLSIFIPAFLIIAAVFFVRVVQYRPLYPKQEKNAPNPAEFAIPIFSDDPVIGDKNAAATLIAFSDPGCSHCQIQFELWKKLLKEYPKKFKIIWKNLPVIEFPYSTELAGDYVFCANQQNKFTDFLGLAFQNSSNLSPTVLRGLAEAVELDKAKLESCLSSGGGETHRQKVEQLAGILNIQAVPTIFLNNKQIEPPEILEGWKTLLGL